MAIRVIFPKYRKYSMTTKSRNASKVLKTIAVASLRQACSRSSAYNPFLLMK